MSKIQREIVANNSQVSDEMSSAGQLKRISDDLLDQIAGGWVNAYFRWSRRF